MRVIAILIGVILLGFSAYVASRPSDYRISRTAEIQAPAAAIFTEVNDLKRWDAWSPWAKLDPNATAKYEGPETGVGSSLSWAGNSDVGEGKMTISESSPNAMIRFDMEFIKPMASRATAEFDFKNSGKTTQVTWTMYGKNSFLAKAVGVFMDCEKMVGSDFEKGLASLKALVEQPKK